MAFEFVARNGILSLSDITGSAGLQLTGLSADNTATTGLFKDGNDAVVTRAFGDLAFSSSIDISTNTNLAGGTNLTLSGDTMNLDANIDLTSVTASFKGDVDGNAATATSATSATTATTADTAASMSITISNSENDNFFFTSVRGAGDQAQFAHQALSFNPSTNILKSVDVDEPLNIEALTITGSFKGNIDGDAVSASYAVTASYADNAGLSVNTYNTSTPFPIVFHDSTGGSLGTDSTGTDFTYNPSTNTLSTDHVSVTTITSSNDVVIGDINAVEDRFITMPGRVGGDAGILFNDRGTVRASIIYSGSQDLVFSTDVPDGQSGPRDFIFRSNNNEVASLNGNLGTLTLSGSLITEKVFLNNPNSTSTQSTGLVINTTTGEVFTRALGDAAFQNTGSMRVLVADSVDSVSAGNVTGLGNSATQDTGSMTVKTAATASAVNVSDTGNPTGASDYRVTMVDDTGTTGETLYVDTGLLFNPDTDKLTVAGDTSIGGDGSVTGDLTVGGTLTAQEFRTEYLTQVVIAQSGSTKLGNTPDDIHEVTGSLLVSEDISLGTQLLVSSSGVGSIGDNSTADIATVPYGSDAVTAVHFDYKIYSTAWHRTGTVMAVGKSGGTIQYTDTSTNEPSSNSAVFSCVDSGGIKLRLNNQTGVTIDADVHIRRF